MSEEGEIVVKGDPDSTRLLNRVMDKVDGILFAHGFEFYEDEGEEGVRWAEAAAAMEKWIFKYYDDLTGGDEDYDPKKPIDDGASSSEAEVADDVLEDDEEPSASETLGSSSDDEEEPTSKKAKNE